MRGNKISVTILLLTMILAGAINAQAASVPLNISFNVNAGQPFDLEVTVDPLGTAIAGAQTDIEFNKSMIIVNNIKEGNLFKKDGTSTFFNGGEINNLLGTVKNIFCFIQGHNNVSTPGTFIIINATAIGTSGTYWINLSNVKISDPNGILVPINEQIPTPTPTPTLSSESSSSSSGGGGAGGTSGEDFNNIQLKEKFDRFINKDIPTSYCFRNATNPIICINITANISPGEINTAVEVLRNTSSLVKDPAPDTVYKNVNIWVGTYGFATPTNIKHAEITFRVPVSWMMSNSIDPDSITMMHYQGAWESLPTRKISETSEWIYYEASTTRFSPHAITGKRSYGASYNWMPQMTPVTDSEPTEQVSTGGKEAESHDDLSKYLIIGILMGIILNAALIYKIRKPKEMDIFKSI